MKKKRSFEVKEHFKVTPEVLYKAWLDSDEHSEMTGAEAECSNKVGGEFTAWDNYIFGSNKSLTPNKEIIQHWRTTEFDEEDEDSEVKLKFQKTSNGCELTITHNDIPDGQPDYKSGWIENYFVPMKAYFEGE